MPSVARTASHQLATANRLESMEEMASISKVPAAEPVLIRDAQEDEKADSSPVNTLQKREDGTDYPSGLKLFLIILALCLSVFLMALGMRFLPFSIYRFFTGYSNGF